MVDVLIAVDHIWTEWSSWGECSASCEVGMATRARQCLPAQYGGVPCDDSPTIDITPCFVRPCYRK